MYKLSLYFQTSNLHLDGFFTINVKFPLTIDMSYKYLEVALNFSKIEFSGVLWSNPTLMIIGGKWTGGKAANGHHRSEIIHGA